MTAVCAACGSSDVSEIPAPHPARSMVSDGRVVHAPLLRVSCRNCGYGARRDALTEGDRDVLYDGDYGLGLQDTDADEQRAAAYGAHVLACVSRHRPHAPLESVVEFGCGTGALLNVIASNASRALGIEPAAQLAAAAKARLAGRASVLEGYAECVLPEGSNADVCYSVNVVEHALDPAEFFAASRRAISADGLVITLCPDGESPGSELLFYDHISSFSLASLCTFAERAGLHLLESKALDGAQTGFRLSAFSPGASDETRQPLRDLTEARAVYLQGWRDLAVHASAVQQKGGLAIFGVGEFCDLLHAYAPEFLESAVAYVVDRPLGGIKFGRTIMSTDDFLRDYRETPLLAAVHARSWRQLRSRFAGTSVQLQHPFEFCSLRTELQ